MKQFPEMWIPCSEQEYPEVKQLLEGMGASVFITAEWLKHHLGVITYANSSFQPVGANWTKLPRVTLPELREIARAHAAANEKWSPEPIPTEPDNLAALETLFANFIEAVAEMRAAQVQYYKTPASRRPEALGIKLNLEKQVDAMIEDVTRKQ